MFILVFWNKFKPWIDIFFYKFKRLLLNIRII